MIYFDAFTAEREQFENFMTKNYYALDDDFEKDNHGSYVKEKAKFLYMVWLFSKQHKKRKQKRKHGRNFVQRRRCLKGFMSNVR